ncbi:hypothetical protein V8F33_001011 [Rhypophila sp. PSN 637]
MEPHPRRRDKRADEYPEDRPHRYLLALWCNSIKPFVSKGVRDHPSKTLLIFHPSPLVWTLMRMMSKAAMGRNVPLSVPLSWDGSLLASGRDKVPRFSAGAASMLAPTGVDKREPACHPAKRAIHCKVSFQKKKKKRVIASVFLFSASYPSVPMERKLDTHAQTQKEGMEEAVDSQHQHEAGGLALGDSCQTKTSGIQKPSPWDPFIIRFYTMGRRVYRSQKCLQEPQNSPEAVNRIFPPSRQYFHSFRRSEMTL